MNGTGKVKPHRLETSHPVNFIDNQTAGQNRSWAESH